jgi:hypothetical protein
MLGNVRKTPKSNSISKQGNNLEKIFINKFTKSISGRKQGKNLENNDQ